MSRTSQKQQTSHPCHSFMEILPQVGPWPILTPKNHIYYILLYLVRGPKTDSLLAKNLFIIAPVVGSTYVNLCQSFGPLWDLNEQFGPRTLKQTHILTANIDEILIWFGEI